ncbi:MAG: hypothetical protein M5U17_10270 [Ignavibacterium sp.]|nr:hypothetical protein [Ignavibacterium sp.]
MCHHTAASGTQTTIAGNCSQAYCPIPRLVELKQHYSAALIQRDSFINQNNEKLSSGKFLKSLAEKIETDTPDVWSHFRKRANDDSADSYNDTLLKHDIETIENTLNRNKRLVEERAEQLINYFNQDNVQRHLLRYHSETRDDSFSLTTATNYVFEDLGKSDKGLEYLASLLSDNVLNELVTVSEVFGLIRQANTLSEELSKFLTFISPCLISEVIETISVNNFRNVREVLNSNIQSKLRFFSEKTGINFDALNSFLNENAEQTARRLNNIIENSLDPAELRQQILRANVNLERAELNDDLIKCVPIGYILKLLSFAIAAYKIVEDFKRSSNKDRISFISSVMEISKDILSIRAVTNSARRGVSLMVGIIGELLGVVVNLMDAVENLQGRDPLLAALNILGATAAFVGMFSGIVVASAETMGLTAVTVAAATVIGSVCIILGIIIAVLIFIFTDPPFIAFIEDTYYGVDNVIPLRETIDKFFKLQIFEMTVRLEGDAPDVRLIVQSNALDDTLPISLKLNKNRVSIGTVLINPTTSSYNGKADIRKYAFWESDRRRTRYLVINKFWELWDNEERGINVREDAGDYALYASLDPDKDGDWEIQTSMNPIEFPRIQPLIRELTIDSNYYVHRGRKYFNYSGNGNVNITIRTVDAIGLTCQILWSADGGVHWSQQSNRIQRNTTQFSFNIPSPPQSNTYTLQVSAKLFNNEGSQTGDTNSVNDIQVGSETYLRNQGII